MFTAEAFIPRITEEQVEAINLVVVGLHEVHFIKPIIDVAEAEKLARSNVNANLIGHETITKVLEVEDNPFGWNFTFQCAGD